MAPNQPKDIFLEKIEEMMAKLASMMLLKKRGLSLPQFKEAGGEMTFVFEKESGITSFTIGPEHFDAPENRLAFLNFISGESVSDLDASENAKKGRRQKVTTQRPVHNQPVRLLNANLHLYVNRPYRYE